MQQLAPQIQWIDAQRDEMLRLVTEWAQINSGTHNLDGLARLSSAVEREFAGLGGRGRRVDLPPAESIDSHGNLVQSPLGQAISIVKRPEAPVRVLLCIHLDTVYGRDHPFQNVTRVDQNTLRGPGVADAKGGIVVMLTALRALEQTDVAEKAGWEVLLNPDEEIGSPGSARLLAEAASRNHCGLLFEPARPDGSLIGARKGSGNFTFVFRGRSAHVGRDFELGRSAILAMADFVHRLESAFSELPGVIVNCGRVEGGSAVNAVPDLAIARVNVRATTAQEQSTIEHRLADLATDVVQRDGISVQLHGGFHSPPKPLDPRSARMFDTVVACGAELGLELKIRSSGGACDGNKLVAGGLPVIDTLGPCGGHTHSDEEYLLIDSLAERAKLTALMLMRLAQ